MNGFQKHGIDHLSASSLNLWRSSPGLWALRYLGKIRDEDNAAILRGKAVETGLHHLLMKQPDCEGVALANFDQNSQGVLTEEIEAERELIAPMVRQCQKWTSPANLIAAQLKVEHYFEGIHIPVIGYLDFVFEDGLIVDLKTTKACPSQPRPDHVRQMAIYMAAREAPGAVLYVTDKRHAFYPISNDAKERALGDLECTARSLMQFLARVNSPQDAMRCLPMDTDHYAFPKLKVPLDQILLAG